MEFIENIKCALMGGNLYAHYRKFNNAELRQKLHTFWKTPIAILVSFLSIWLLFLYFEEGVKHIFIPILSYGGMYLAFYKDIKRRRKIINQIMTERA